MPRSLPIYTILCLLFLSSGCNLLEGDSTTKIHYERYTYRPPDGPKGGSAPELYGGYDFSTSYTPSWRQYNSGVPANNVNASDETVKQGVQDLQALSERLDDETTKEQIIKYLPARPNSPWQCLRCSYHNESWRTHCEFCSERRLTVQEMYKALQDQIKSVTLRLEIFGYDHSRSPRREYVDNVRAQILMLERLAGAHQMLTELPHEDRLVIEHVANANNITPESALLAWLANGQQQGAPLQANGQQQASAPMANNNDPVRIPDAWKCTDIPEEVRKEGCLICANEQVFKDEKANACKCPKCHKIFCQNCFKDIVKASRSEQHYNYHNGFGARYRLKKKCPFCSQDFSSH